MDSFLVLKFYLLFVLLSLECSIEEANNALSKAQDLPFNVREAQTMVVRADHGAFEREPF
jgi:hypothetical protein